MAKKLECTCLKEGVAKLVIIELHITQMLGCLLQHKLIHVLVTM